MISPSRIAQSNPVYLVRTKNRDSEDCYFVLRTTAARYHRLLAKQKKESINIAEYGEILASGYGRFPSPRVIHDLKQNHGIELPQDE